MEKKGLQELRNLLEQLKTVSKRKVDDKAILEASVKEIDKKRYVPMELVEELLTKKFVTHEKYVCTLNNGEDIVREKIQKGKKDGSAVVIIPVTEDNEIIVTVEPRVFTEKTVGVGFPAGYIEKDEEPYQSAYRELQEEVGVIPQKLIPLASFYQDEGISAAKNTAYLAIGCTEGHEKNPDEGEFIGYFKCSFGDVLELQEEGYIEGSNSIIAIEKAKPYFTKDGKIKQKYKQKGE